MNDFISARDRDAWATIRGYVYQVDLTIDRWINLRENECLELERGEDIDIVSEAITCSDEQRERILEQIKHRDKNITLRSPEAIEAIVSFYEHLNENSNINIMFRFVTNAKVSTERPSLFSDKTPAINVWEQIRCGMKDKSSVTERLQKIREFLLVVSRPDAIKGSLWSKWLGFIKSSDDDELLNFIKKFEWSSTNTPFQKLDREIQKKLLNLQIVKNDEQAVNLYQRLFLYVFKQLSKSGIKRFTKNELFAQKDITSLEKHDQELLYNLQALWKQLDIRVHSLENVVQEQQKQFSIIDEQIEKFKTEVGFQASIDLSIQRPALDIPFFENMVTRKELVDFFIQELQNKTWCALYGDLGSGKTNLAALIAKVLGTSCKAWIRLRDLSPGQATLRIDDTLHMLSGKSPNGNWKQWYREVCSTLSPGTLIVIDDIPRTNGATTLDERLVMFARECVECGIKLLSTSSHTLSSSITQNLQQGILNQYEVPKFTKKEVIDLLAIYEAPLTFLRNEKLIALLTSLTEGHPVLLTAAVRYLHDKDWMLNNDNIQALFQGEHTHELNELLQDQLINKLEDSDSRQLLYRLTLIRAPFSFQEVKKVSEVSPVIPSPFEKVNKAIGLWIQRDTPKTYLVSPLLNIIGTLNLEEDTKKNTHFILGKGIIDKKQIHPLEGLKALQHFVSAEAYKEAALTLISGLNQMEEYRIYSDEWGFNLIWTNMPLPEKMDFDIKLILRVKQIMVLGKMGKNIDYLLQDLESLIQLAEEDYVLANLVSIYPAHFYTEKDPIKANIYLSRFLNKINFITSFKENQFIDEKFNPSSLIWVTGFRINSTDKLLEWLDTLLLIPQHQLESAAKDDFAAECCMKICDQIWLKEIDKREPDRKWDEILNNLDKVAVFARELGLDLLWACAIRAQIIVLSEYKDDISTALKLANKSLNLASSNPETQFIIKGIMGTQYVYKELYSEAVIWLAEALQNQITAYPTERIYCYIHLSKVFGENNPKQALFFTKQAIEIARQEDNIPKQLRVKVLGEHIIAMWLAGELPDIYPYYEEAIEYLLEADKTEEIWKILFVAFGHVSGYLSSIIETGHPPTQTGDGEAYLAPTRGFLIKNHPLMVNVYNPSKDWFLSAHLSMVAESLRKDAEAEKWMLITFDLALEKGTNREIGLLGTKVIPYLISKHKYSVALDIALETETIFELYRRGLGLGADRERIIGKRTDDDWASIEERGAELSIIPSVLSLLKLKINEPDKAFELSIHLSNICRQMKLNSAIPAFWESVAENIDNLFSEKLSYEGLIEQGNNTHNSRTSKFISYIGASLLASPEDALRIYNSIGDFLESRYKGLGKIYGDIILPFIMDYWALRFEQQRSCFSYPNYVEKQLNKCYEASEEERLSELLKVLRFSLKIS